MKDDLDIEAREKVLVLSPHMRRAYRLEDPIDAQAVPVSSHASSDSSEMQNDPDSRSNGKKEAQFSASIIQDRARRFRLVIRSLLDLDYHHLPLALW